MKPIEQIDENRTYNIRELVHVLLVKLNQIIRAVNYLVDNMK